MSEQFSALAPHLQGVVGVLILVGSGTWAVIKFFKPFIDNIHKPAPETAKPVDAVVVSAALADSRAMHTLAESIDRNTETHERGNIINQMLLEAITRLVLKP